MSRVATGNLARDVAVRVGAVCVVSAVCVLAEKRSVWVAVLASEELVWGCVVRVKPKNQVVFLFCFCFQDVARNRTVFNNCKCKKSPPICNFAVHRAKSPILFYNRKTSFSVITFMENKQIL
jgi:hypothetical protein